MLMPLHAPGKACRIHCMNSTANVDAVEKIRRKCYVLFLQATYQSTLTEMSRVFTVRKYGIP